MVSPCPDRRRAESGSIICDNGAVRFRIVRPGASLGLVIEARDAQNMWLPLATTPADDTAEMQFHAFDPVTVDGQTRGVILSGRLGDAHVTLTSTLPDASTWSQHLLTFNNIPPAPCRLTQHWRLAAAFSDARICWPQRMLQGEAFVENPAIFQQADASFVALVPDLEESEGLALIARSHPWEHPGLEYGFFTEANRPAAVRLAYALCVDARAVPLRGFQQIVRQAGSQELFATTIGTGTTPVAGELPALPPMPDAGDWCPFSYEGSPAAIAALVHFLLSQAEQGDWQRLEDGLCWLDRLCFHQHAHEFSAGTPLGAFGTGPAWQVTRLWVPSLLLQAFRLTGIAEYAARACAAIGALPAPDQALVRGQLYPAYGDIYVHAESQETLVLGPMRVYSAVCHPGTIRLVYVRTSEGTSTRLVVDGVDTPVHVTVNGHSLGVMTPEQLSAGVELR